MWISSELQVSITTAASQLHVGCTQTMAPSCWGLPPQCQRGVCVYVPLSVVYCLLEFVPCTSLCPLLCSLYCSFFPIFRGVQGSNLPVDEAILQAIRGCNKHEKLCVFTERLDSVWVRDLVVLGESIMLQWQANIFAVFNVHCILLHISSHQITNVKQYWKYQYAVKTVEYTL